MTLVDRLDKRDRKENLLGIDLVDAYLNEVERII